jgi:hypothetical protein
MGSMEDGRAAHRALVPKAYPAPGDITLTIALLYPIHWAGR